MNIIQKAKAFIAGREYLEEQFNSTLSVKIAVGDRVRHRGTNELGHVYQTGQVDGTVRVPAVSVRYDNGNDAQLVPAEEFTKATKYPPNRY